MTSPGGRAPRPEAGRRPAASRHLPLPLRAPPPGAFRRPADRELSRLFALTLSGARLLARPEFHGLELVPDDRPLLFVGNHTLYGVLDVPFLYEALHREKGILLRGLGDDLHFQLPLWRDLLTRYGVVHGTRENCAELFRAGECVLVFPGGAREVAKRRGEQNRLLWKERTGFATMALRHGCTIVPFTALGVDDAFDLWLDADDLLRGRTGRALERLGLRADAVPPVPRRVRPQKLYFRIAPPIRLAEHGGRDDPRLAREIRDRVAASVEDGFRFLEERRAADPDRDVLAALRRSLRARSRAR